MTIQENIERLQQAKLDLKVAITAKGVDVDDSALIDEYADYVSEIEQGASGNRLNDFFKGDVTAITASDLAGVTTISDYLFYDKSGIKSVNLPSSVTAINQYAFAESGIANLDIPDSVTTIGQYAFNNCKSLTGVTIGNGVTSLGNYCFKGCSSLTGDFVIPANVEFTAYNSALWQGCSGITSFTFEGSPKNIGYTSAYSAWFSGCTSVQYFDFSRCASVPVLQGTINFTQLTQDYAIRVPEILYDEWVAADNWSDASIVSHIVSVPSPLDNVVFHYTSTDGNIIQPNTGSSVNWGVILSNTYDSENDGQLVVYGCSEIPYSAFSGKTTLESFEIVSGATQVTKIGISAFFGCLSLKTVGGLTNINTIKGNAFQNCQALISVDDLSSVTNLEGWALRDCYNLETVDLSSVQIIGDYALFGDNKLASIGDLSNCRSIGTQAFQNCYDLTAITINNTTVPTGNNNMFSGTTFTIYVPASAVDAYKAAPYWSNYADRIQAIQE